MVPSRAAHFTTGIKALKDNVTNPSNENLKETGFKISSTKEACLALCK